MRLKVFVIYDSKAEAFLQPFYMQTKGQAIRAWQDTIEDKNSQFAKHPADFTLFEIAEYDEVEGMFKNLPNKLNLGTALELKNAKEV